MNAYILCVLFYLPYFSVDPLVVKGSLFAGAMISEVPIPQRLLMCGEELLVVDEYFRLFCSMPDSYIDFQVIR